MGSFGIVHWIILLICLPISFAPSIVAFVRKHRQKWLVFLLNLLAGWTGIGWIAALIWAIVGKPSEPAQNFDETFR